MPEGHSVHRIARQFAHNFLGHRVAVSSPQGRFAEGASLIDGRVITDSRAVGKQMFLEFDHELWLRVHLGIYGAWDFAGAVSVDPTIASANGRIGQTNQRGTMVDSAERDSAELGSAVLGSVVLDSAGENSLHSIGAPRRTRLRMAEQETLQAVDAPGQETFPPEPIGQVRVRLLTDTAVADLRGPTACEVLDPAQVHAVIAKLGPDPLVQNDAEIEDRFVSTIRKKPTPIALLLMDQSVVSGIGNVYRAELLFRARLNPHTPGKKIPEGVARELWRDWARLLKIGVETGQMMTMAGLDDDAYARAMASLADRHWVYKRDGLPCRVCGTHIQLEKIGSRKLYWCPSCQA